MKQNRRRILIIVDKTGWSYDTIARGLVRYADDERLRFDIVAQKTDADYIERNHQRYDLVFAIGWTSVFSKKPKDNYRELMPWLERSRLVTGIHSHRSWDDYRSMPDSDPPPPVALVQRLAGLRGINIISRRLYRIFERAGLQNICLTENGVDAELFRPSQAVGTDRRKPFCIGFSGATETRKHDWLKGFSEFIEPLGALPNVSLEVLGGRGEHQVAREQMPALYNGIDMYICASTSEGFSQSVLEASACGRGVVSTRVGGCEDLVQDGVNGYLVERDYAQLAALVTRLEADREKVALLGQQNRLRVEQRYSWSNRVADWLHFIDAHLGDAASIR